MRFLKKNWPGLLIFVLAFLQYSNTFDHNYAWDDAIVITQNERVQKGIKGIPELFMNYRSLKVQDKYGYRPVTLITFAIEYEFFGLNPRVGHVSNALWFGLLCFVLFLVLRELMNRHHWLLAFLVTLIFVAHPLHVEVVANIKSRDEILALLFGLGMIHFFIRLIRTNNFLNLIGILACMVYAFLAKESAIILALWLPLIYFYDADIKFSIKLEKEVLWKYGKLLLVGGLVLILVFLLLRIKFIAHTDLMVNELEGMDSEDVNRKTWYLGNPLTAEGDHMVVLANAFYLMLLYLRNFFLGGPLIHDYGYNIIPLKGWGDWEVIASLVLHLGALGYSAWGIFKRHLEALGFLIYMASMIIYTHVFTPGPDLMADRFMFVPSIGLGMLVVGLFNRIMKVDFEAKRGVSKLSWGFLGLMILISGYYSYRTFERNPAWKDNFALFSADKQKCENGARFHYNLGVEMHYDYYNQPQERQKEYQQQVLHHYGRSIEISDSTYKAFIDLGSAYMEFGKPDKALATFKKAEKVYPRVGGPKFQIGRFYMSLEKFEEAIPYLKSAIDLAPEIYPIYSHLGLCYLKTQELDLAKKVIGEGMKYNPTAPYFNTAGDIYLASGDKDEGIRLIKQAVEMDPNDAQLLSNLVERSLMVGDTVEAQQYYQQGQQKFGWK